MEERAADLTGAVAEIWPRVLVEPHHVDDGGEGEDPEDDLGTGVDEPGDEIEASLLELELKEGEAI